MRYSMKGGVLAGFAALIALASGGDLAAQTAQTAQTPERARAWLYENPNYGYAVRIPAGVKAQTAQEPNPNHGFGVDIGAAHLWVGAAYMTEGNSLKDLEAQERESWSARCKQLSRQPARLARLPAARVVRLCEGTVEEPGTRACTQVMTLVSRPHASLAKLEVVVCEPAAGPKSGAMRQLFQYMVRGVYLLPAR